MILSTNYNIFVNIESRQYLVQGLNWPIVGGGLNEGDDLMSPTT